jgi:hypothetical protein
LVILTAIFIVKTHLEERRYSKKSGQPRFKSLIRGWRDGIKNRYCIRVSFRKGDI